MNAAGCSGFSGDCVTQKRAAGSGYLFTSDNLEAHWPMLDAFEDGYDRVEVDVITTNGEQLSAWIYQLQPQTQP
jgi:gamma-glutamylcyclotransferase (GGCT)/AIG2-like uncharacterized protein YtfP